MNAGGAIAFNKDPTGRGYQFSINGPDSQLDINGNVIELQGNGEEATFSEAQLAALLTLGKTGVRRLLEMQQAALA